MKKLLALSVILLLVGNIFGQTQGIFGLIYDEPEYLNFERMHADGNVESFINGTTPYYNLLKLKYYSFIKDNKLYMLSYGNDNDTINTIMSGGVYFERALYLFCWDKGVWNRASDVIQVDQKFENGGIRGYLPMFDGYYGQSVTEVGDCILIKFACHFIPDGDFFRSGICSSEISIKEIVLMPNGDGTYTVLHGNNKKL